MPKPVSMQRLDELLLKWVWSVEEKRRRRKKKGTAYEKKDAAGFFIPALENNRKRAAGSGGRRRRMAEYFASRSPEISRREKAHMERYVLAGEWYGPFGE